MQDISPRTHKYFKAMQRDGPLFDYKKWLREVQEEEKSVKRPAALPLSQPAVPSAPNTAAVNSVFASGEARESPRQSKSGGRERAGEIETRPNSLQGGLSDVSNAWEEFQETRDRDAVYGYLGAVFCLVLRYKCMGGVNRLVRRVQKLGGIPRDKGADPFAVVIRVTTSGDVDAKTCSKWSRALRFAARCKRRESLRSFMKRKGGINACASRFAATRK